MGAILHIESIKWRCIIGNDIYQTLELWVKLSPSSCEPKNVASHSLLKEDSNSELEQDIEAAMEGQGYWVV